MTAADYRPYVLPSLRRLKHLLAELRILDAAICGAVALHYARMPR